MLKQVPVGDHQANGLIENAINNVQGQLRVTKNALESACRRRVEGDRPAALWMMRRAASVVNRGREDDEGFAAHRRRGSRELTKPVAEFGECIAHAPALSVGKDKFDV